MTAPPPATHPLVGALLFAVGVSAIIMGCCCSPQHRRKLTPSFRDFNGIRRTAGVGRGGRGIGVGSLSPILFVGLTLETGYEGGCETVPGSVAFRPPSVPDVSQVGLLM